MDTRSHWQKTVELPRFASLNGTLTVDVAIVGAGITGITTAYLLKKAGLRVALLERARCGGVDTAHTTAHLTAVPDLRLYKLEDRFGSQAAKAVWDAGTTALNRIHSIVEAENIACHFRWCSGYLHASSHSYDTALLLRDAACAQTLGIPAEFRPSIPLFQLPGIAFPQQAMFHPHEYLAALLAVIPGNGSHVFEDSAVLETEKFPRSVETKKGRVLYDHLVVATHNPVTGNYSLLQASLFQTKLALYTSYALGARLSAHPWPEGCFWDTEDPYHYLRLEPIAGGTYAIYGGEDHKTGQASDTVASYQRLEENFRRIFPEAEIDARWSGQVIETNDGLPYIGEIADRQFVATGFAGNGMTLGTLSAIMALDAIQGRYNPWQSLFEPHRKPHSGGGMLNYLRENKDYPRQLIYDRFAPTEAATLSELETGDGRIVRLGKRKLAAHRNEAGEIMLCSAICTHLQCTVAWNAAEQTWDCPCHGSRFRPDGQVISGPAEDALTRFSPATGLPVRPRHTASPA